MTPVTFVFTATECQGWPRIRIAVDGDVLVEHDFDQDRASVTVDLDLDSGHHCFEIERWGKQSFNMVLQDNSIVADQTVTLESIYIQDVCLPDWFMSSGQFHWEGGVIDQGIIWGPNGVYRIEFEYPLISWILKEKVRRWPSVISLYPPTDQNQQHLRELLDQFEKDLKRVRV
jgi:hypothetical protein